MKQVKVMMFATLAILMLGNISFGQALSGRSGIELQVGYWNQTTDVRTSVGITGVETSVNSGGAGGGLRYQYWIRENLAVTANLGYMLTRIETAVDYTDVTHENAGIGSILLGVKYYPAAATFSTTFRPYGTVSFGPFIGSQSMTTVGMEVVNESKTMLAIGGKFGIGADIILSRLFKLGMEIGYHLMTDFDEPLSGSKNYSGPEFNFGFGIMLGKGHTDYQ